MTAERVLMGLLLGAVSVGCILVLYPFFSALLWAASLVYTTWPVCEWLRLHLRLPRGAAAGLMVLLTAVMRLRQAIEATLRAGLPGSPTWVFAIPLVGPTVGSLWNRCAEDVSEMLEA